MGSWGERRPLCLSCCHRRCSRRRTRWRLRRQWWRAFSVSLRRASMVCSRARCPLRRGPTSQAHWARAASRPARAVAMAAMSIFVLASAGVWRRAGVGGSGSGRVLEGAEARPFLCSLPPGSGSGWALEVFPRALAIGPDGRGVGGCSRGGLMRWAMAAPFAPSALRQAQDRQAPSWEGRTGQDERFSAWAGPEKSGGVRGRSRLALGMRAALRPFFFPPTRPGGMGAADGSRRSLLRQAASWEGRMRSG